MAQDLTLHSLSDATELLVEGLTLAQALPLLIADEVQGLAVLDLEAPEAF